jgi:hypothetical protein
MSQPHAVAHDAARIARSRTHEARRETVPDAAWQQFAGGTLRAMGAELDDAAAATDRRDWVAVLEAVRMIQGRATITRATLERWLGSAPTGDGLPPLVRAVRAVGLLIREGEVDSLPSDELRVRMHAVLQTLDYELGALLQPPD